MGGGLFGGGKARQDLKSTTELVTDVLMSDVQNCSTFFKTVQVQAQVGDVNVMTGGRQTAALQINNTCYASADKINEVQNDIIVALMQKAEVVTSGFSLDKAKSVIENEITTSVRNNITQEFIQDCITSGNNYQAQLQIGGYNIQQDMQQDVTMNAVQECVAASSNVSRIANDVGLDVETTQEVESKNFVATMIDAVGGILNGFLWIIIIGFIILLVFFGWFFSGEEGAQRVQNVGMAAEMAKQVTAPASAAATTVAAATVASVVTPTTTESTLPLEETPPTPPVPPPAPPMGVAPTPVKPLSVE